MSANRSVDDYAIKTCGIPDTDLMKNAGEAVVEQMDLHGFLRTSVNILILTGKGNNGGDGYVIAASLIQRGFKVSLLSMVDGSELSGAASHYFNKLEQLAPILELWQNTAHQRDQISKADVIVDALLGTGVSGTLKTAYAEVIACCNNSPAQVVAVDVPSGVTGDMGAVLVPCIKADITVSMGYGKQGCLFEPARHHCGHVILVDIGFPADSLQHVDNQILDELKAGDFKPEEFSRPSDAHKYSTGKVYVIAGSRGFTGAALLASTAALRAGAGLVKLALPESLGQIGETASLETIVEYLPENQDLSFSSKAFSALKLGCDWADVVALGPGMGRNPDTMNLTRQLIQEVECPLVIDADALFALIDNLQLLKDRQAPTILTPHRGEFQRLIDEGAPAWRDASAFAQEYGVYVLLKGAPSILAAPQGEVTANSSGYSGMATAGSGDVLTGVIAGLWAQWNQVPEVLNLAMFMHGQAADLNRSEKGVLGLIAGDIINSLPAALKEYGALPV